MNENIFHSGICLKLENIPDLICNSDFQYRIFAFTTARNIAVESIVRYKTLFSTTIF